MTSMSDTPPLILLPACRMDKDGLSFHTIGDKYVRAVAEGADAVPVMLPSLPGLVDVADVLGRVDGIVLTGSPSNVHPNEYGHGKDPKAEPYDSWRDGVTLPLIRAAVELGVPLFAICRGMQELNVALGGTLYPRIHEVEGRMDHRRPCDESLDVQYGPRHTVEIASGGMLENILGRGVIEVNSLHWQGVAKLAQSLRIEASAEDGTVEAVSLPDAPGFVLGVQWHPEYRMTENPDALKLFQAFAKAARAWSKARQKVASIS